MTARAALILPVGLLLALAGCVTAEPYFGGAEPIVDDIVPNWENGISGGQIVLSYIDDIDNPTEEENQLLGEYVVTISGDFSECLSPLVTLGNRNARVVSRNDSALSILTPPGPISGGTVEVAIVCEEGVKRIADGYDYVLGDAVTRSDEGVYLNHLGEPARRMGDLYANEYGSMSVIYPAEPFINWPDPQVIGFVHTQPAPRQAAFYLNNGQPELEYGGVPLEIESEDGPFPRQLAHQPGLDWDAAPQGDEVSAGDAISFFRQRNTSEADPLTGNARKIRNQNPLAPDPNSPQPHDPTQTPNNSGVWFEVNVDGTLHFLRAAQWTGSWCDDNVGREGCVDDATDDADIAQNLFLDNTRIGFDWRPRWFAPDKPTREVLQDYPTAAPEFLTYLDCLDAGGTEDDCLASGGFEIPTGTYENVRIIQSTDEDDSWPWLPDGFIRVLEVLPSVEITEGGNYLDVGALVVGEAVLDDDNPNRIFYLAESLGENVMPLGQPVFISYPGGFFRGVSVPSKNPDMEFPTCGVDGALPEPGTECYDDFPWLLAPTFDTGTWFNADTIGGPTASVTVDDPLDPEGGTVDLEYTTGGFSYWLPLDPAIPELTTELLTDWRIALPGRKTSLVEGEDGEFPRNEEDLRDGAWGDNTFFVAELTVRDLDAQSGFGADWLWRTNLFAWAGEDYIVFPKEQLATLPRIGDLTRPDNEVMVNDNLLGSYAFNVRRVASFPIGEPFTNANGRMVFDLNAMSTFYFHTEHGCFDGFDNDGDGLCDVAGCNDPENPDIRLPADPACTSTDTPEYETSICQNGEDDDNDGLIDLEDPDCEHPNDPEERATCADGVDNDYDGWTDLDDPGCTESQDHYEYDETNPATPPLVFDPSEPFTLIPPDAYRYSYLTECNDGIDDDGDGGIDSEDPSCENGADDSEGGDNCDDGIDNNGDGWIDREDITCLPGSEVEPEGEPNAGYAGDFECSDFNRTLQPDGTFADVDFDNDGDGTANFADPECAYGWDPSGEANAPTACADLIDNDGDGWIDGLDAQCDLNPDSEEEGLTQSGTCADGEDNDTDGWIDVDDPDCNRGADNEVVFSRPLACNDHEDNDGDGFIDSEDPGCSSGKDIHEEDPE